MYHDNIKYHDIDNCMHMGCVVGFITCACICFIILLWQDTLYKSTCTITSSTKPIEMLYKAYIQLNYDIASFVSAVAVRKMPINFTVAD